MKELSKLNIQLPIFFCRIRMFYNVDIKYSVKMGRTTRRTVRKPVRQKRVNKRSQRRVNKRSQRKTVRKPVRQRRVNKKSQRKTIRKSVRQRRVNKRRMVKKQIGGGEAYWENLMDGLTDQAINHFTDDGEIKKKIAEYVVNISYVAYHALKRAEGNFKDEQREIDRKIVNVLGHINDIFDNKDLDNCINDLNCGIYIKDGDSSESSKPPSVSRFLSGYKGKIGVADYGLDLGDINELKEQLETFLSDLPISEHQKEFWYKKEGINGWDSIDREKTLNNKFYFKYRDDNKKEVEMSSKQLKNLLRFIALNGGIYSIVELKEKIKEMENAIEEEERAAVTEAAPTPAPAPAPVTEPEPVTEPAPAPAQVIKPAPVTVTEPAPVTVTAPAPVTEPKQVTEPVTEQQPKPVTVTEPGPVIKPVTEPAPGSESETEPKQVSESTQKLIEKLNEIIKNLKLLESDEQINDINEKINIILKQEKLNQIKTLELKTISKILDKFIEIVTLLNEEDRLIKELNTESPFIHTISFDNFNEFLDIINDDNLELSDNIVGSTIKVLTSAVDSIKNNNQILENNLQKIKTTPPPQKTTPLPPKRPLRKGVTTTPSPQKTTPLPPKRRQTTTTAPITRLLTTPPPPNPPPSSESDSEEDEESMLESSRQKREQNKEGRDKGGRDKGERELKTYNQLLIENLKTVSKTRDLVNIFYEIFTKKVLLKNKMSIDRNK